MWVRGSMGERSSMREMALGGKWRHYEEDVISMGER